MRRYALIILNANHTLCLTHRWRCHWLPAKDSKASWELPNTVSHHPAALCKTVGRTYFFPVIAFAVIAL